MPWFVFKPGCLHRQSGVWCNALTIPSRQLLVRRDAWQQMWGLLEQLWGLWELVTEHAGALGRHAWQHCWSRSG